MRPISRVVRGLAALGLLVGLFVGVPLLLLRVGRLPELASIDLLRPDDGTVLLGLLTVVGWAAWLMLALLLLIEIVNVVAGWRIRLPGLAGPQRLIAGLVLAVAALAATAQTATAAPITAPDSSYGDVPAGAYGGSPGVERGLAQGTDDQNRRLSTGHPAQEQPPHSAQDDQVQRSAEQPGASRQSSTTVEHIVKRGDTLWDLAEYHYDDGRQWRTIYDANAERICDPDELEIGWRLQLPGAIKAGGSKPEPTNERLSESSDPDLGEDSGQPRSERDESAADKGGPDDAGSGSDSPHARSSAGQRDPDRTAAEPRADAAQPKQDGVERDRSGRPADSAERPVTGSSRVGQPRADQPGHAETGTSAAGGGHRERIEGDWSEPSPPESSGSGPRDSEARDDRTETNGPSSTDSSTRTETRGGADSDAGTANAGDRPGSAEAMVAVDSPATFAGALTGGLAAGLIALVAVRRRRRLWSRAAGQQLSPNRAPGDAVATGLAAVTEPAMLPNLATAMGEASHHLRMIGRQPPLLTAVRVGGRDHPGMVSVEFAAQRSASLAEPRDATTLPAPPGWSVTNGQWRRPADLRPAGSDRTAASSALPVLPDPDRGDTEHGGPGESGPGINITEQDTLWPALVCVGWGPSEEAIFVDLERFGILNLQIARRDPESGERAADFATALLFELITMPWADRPSVIMVGEDEGLAAAIDEPNVSTVGQLADALPALQRLAMERRNQPDESHRLDASRSEAWQPVVVFCLDPTRAELADLAAVCSEGTGIVAITAGQVLDGSTHHTELDLTALPAELSGIDFAPQLIPAMVRAGLRRLLQTSGNLPTEPAWWWDQPMSQQQSGPKPVPGAARALTVVGGELPPSGRASPHERDRQLDEPLTTGHLSGALGSLEIAPSEEMSVAEPTPGQPSAGNSRTGHPSTGHSSSGHSVTGHLVTGFRRRATEPPFGELAPPTIGLLGSVQLHGATGEPPTRARRQCIEYAAWLLENPGATGQQMARGLLVAEGTRRSNMSRLRIWLGGDRHGDPYLPDAYSGRIELHPDVTSDWLRLQALVAGGVNRASLTALAAALELVRGEPLADAVPGQWVWADQLRLDMRSLIRDCALVLAERAIESEQFELARWATHQGIVAAEEDEQLFCTELRIEHAEGNVVDAERLALRMTRKARALGVDLSEGTITLIQKVLEGRPRRRA